MFSYSRWLPNGDVFDLFDRLRLRDVRLLLVFRNNGACSGSWVRWLLRFFRNDRNIRCHYNAWINGLGFRLRYNWLGGCRIDRLRFDRLWLNRLGLGRPYIERSEFDGETEGRVLGRRRCHRSSEGHENLVVLGSVLEAVPCGERNSDGVIGCLQRRAIVELDDDVGQIVNLDVIEVAEAVLLEVLGRH